MWKLWTFITRMDSMIRMSAVSRAMRSVMGVRVSGTRVSCLTSVARPAPLAKKGLAFAVPLKRVHGSLSRWRQRANGLLQSGQAHLLPWDVQRVELD